MKFISRPKTKLVPASAMSRHQNGCHNTKPAKPGRDIKGVSRDCPSWPWSSTYGADVVAHARVVARCCARSRPYPELLAPYLSRPQNLVMTQRQKWVVAHSSLSLAHFFSFLFVLPIVKPNEIVLLLQRLLNHGKLTKMYMLYKEE